MTCKNPQMVISIGLHTRAEEAEAILSGRVCGTCARADYRNAPQDSAVFCRHPGVAGFHARSDFCKAWLVDPRYPPGGGG